MPLPQVARDATHPTPIPQLSLILRDEGLPRPPSCSRLDMRRDTIPVVRARQEDIQPNESRTQPKGRALVPTVKIARQPPFRNPKPQQNSADRHLFRGLAQAPASNRAIATPSRPDNVAIHRERATDEVYRTDGRGRGDANSPRRRIKGRLLYYDDRDVSQARNHF